MILARALVRSHVEALLRKMPQPDAAVLGCTHYPLLADTFREALGAGVRVIEQPAIVADALADYLERRPQFAGVGGRVMYLTTGDPALVSERAGRFLGHPVNFEAA